MSKLNIYRIVKASEVILMDKLSKVGLDIVSDKTDDNNVRMIFLFSKNPRPSPIGWANFYKDLLGPVNVRKAVNKSYFGVMIISHLNYCYAISLGKSHFYLKDYCELDFGIELGTRIIDKSKIDMKNSRLFGGSRKKNITTYQRDTDIEVDSGEAIVYLKGKTIDDSWGNTVNCGNSTSFIIKKITPQSIPSFIKKIEEKLKDNALFSVPSSTEIKNKDLITALNKRLIASISNNQSMMFMEEQSISGVEFIFTKEYRLYLEGKRDLEIDQNGTLKDLNNLIERAKIDITSVNFDNIKIQSVDENGIGFYKNIKHFIDYIDDDNHFLQDGRWYQFNQYYIEFLHDSISNIGIEVKRDLNFDYKSFKTWWSQLAKTEQKKWYAEKYFNEYIAQNHGYMNFDRDIGKYDRYKLEFTDLYKGNTLYFVKIGPPQKIGYVIDQSLAVLKYLQEHKGIIELNGETMNPKEICIWLILDRKNEIESLIDLKSFIFLMKLNDWKKQVVNVGYIPKIQISYKV